MQQNIRLDGKACAVKMDVTDVAGVRAAVAATDRLAVG